MRFSIALAALALPFAALACSSSDGAEAAASNPGADGGSGGKSSTTAHGGGGSSSSSGTFVEAEHPAPHQIVNLGGPVMSAPKVVPIYFDNDDASTPQQIDDFLSRMQSAPYFPQTVAEYGVGAMTVLPAVHLNEAAGDVLSDTDVAQFVADRVDSGALPAADLETIYAVFYPSNTTISLGGFGESCGAFGGYHDSTSLAGGGQAVYAVIPRCPATDGFSAFQNLTDTTSHEIIEAATDPVPSHDPAWGSPDLEHFYVQYTLLAELGDQCSFVYNDYASFPPEMPYTVQRSWSNASAAAGHDPCVPIPEGQVYFNSAIDPPDTQTFDDGHGGAITIKTNVIPVGQTGTAKIVLFSDGPTSDWDVRAYDYSQVTAGGAAALEFTQDRTSGNNGDVITLTIHVLQSMNGGFEPYVLISQNNTTGLQQIWPGMVYSP